MDSRTYRLTESFDMPFGREGQPVYVWIDPGNPSRSRLDADKIRDRLGYSSPGFSKLFIVVGALLCVFALFMRFAPSRLHDLVHLPSDLIQRLKGR